MQGKFEDLHSMGTFGAGTICFSISIRSCTVESHSFAVDG